MASVARALKKQTDGRLVKAENLHLTLAFIGSVTAEQQQCMQQAASEIQVPHFSLSFSETGYWPRPRVAWLGCREMPAELLQLASQLNARLSECGYQPDRRPFQAHVTLLRKARRYPKNTEIDEILWSVDRFVLVESITHAEGVEYQVVEQWPLS